LTRSFNVAGDRPGQQSTGYRWPYGSCAVVSPFNFPLEIPCLQIFGGLIAGNKIFFKGDNRVNVVMEQFLRLALYCGLPAEDVDMMFGGAKATEQILKGAKFRNTQFTGSSVVAEHLTKVLNGKIRIEDAGFDWKILGPDVPDPNT
jgi:1-pyrroline-5-carboxylate dehydrogenase